ncbi:type VII secretion integral membrane protein EccD [Actinoplanes lutulentus]|uniref:Type VII secretion integral membrane protein EccD n=1 Tax=Actinoplanes lutulentus TaxID=1287878 RepID=A0A327ZH14_9ACTN|nr:type VII secretion integral membrane protein EccD [Actinoplanes lutulentus]MBB2941769.1 type VII secretion integral membrane protein EccD [Actinoplanes lutulentus]RAK39689.1 type VII secretion integral membrane protein EccD [Actinoplanes lutulentus]
MTAPGGPSLARVTIAAPTRRMDLALPDNMLVAELLPHLLRHASPGEPADFAGGWVLRRATGTVLEPGRNLAAQGVRDGELLHLSPAREDWPELAYDDVVEVIASGSRRAGRTWSDSATRRCGLAVTAGALLLGIAGLALDGPPWVVTAVVALGVALALTVSGILLSRAFSDAGAGAIVAASGLPYAFLGGAWLLSAPSIGAPGLLLGSSALLVLSVLGHVGVAGLTRLFVAGTAAGLTGLIAAALALAGVSADGSAAVALTAAIGLLPAYPVLAGWLGRLPFPELPNRAEEILKDKPVPRREDVFTAVVRSGEVLSGLLLAAALSSFVAMTFLALNDPGVSAVLLMVAAVSALLLRARLLPTPTQRVPLLVAGFAGLAGLGAGPVISGAVPGLVLLAGAIAVAAIALPAALIFSRRPPSPYLGRAADILDVVAIMALIPLAFAVIGVFDNIRGLFASIGG